MSAAIESKLVVTRAPAPALPRPGKFFRAAAVPVFLLVVWEVVCLNDVVSPLVLPAPGQVAVAFCALVRSGQLAGGVAISLWRLVWGYGIGVAMGLAVGIVMAASPLVKKLIGPSFYAIARVPLLAWVPFLMVIFGIGEALKLAIIAKAAMTPVAMNTERAMEGISPAWVELGRLLRLPARVRLVKILLPATILPIFVGLRFGLIQAWSALVVVELLASSRGIGYQLMMSRQLFQLDTMMALMAVIGVIGFVLDRGLAAGEGYLARRFGGAA